MSDEYAMSRVDASAMGLQCPECGAPVDVMEARMTPPHPGSLQSMVGESVVLMEPCGHQLPTAQLEHAFGIA